MTVIKDIYSSHDALWNLKERSSRKEDKYHMDESTVFLNDVNIQLPPLQEIYTFLTFAYITFPRVIDFTTENNDSSTSRV